jgi:hypothetical protein
MEVGFKALCIPAKMLGGCGWMLESLPPSCHSTRSFSNWAVSFMLKCTTWFAMCGRGSARSLPTTGLARLFYWANQLFTRIQLRGSIKLATKYKTILGALDKADPNKSDLKCVVEANAMQVAAMISYRCREYELLVEFCDLLEMTNAKQPMYQQLAS